MKLSVRTGLILAVGFGASGGALLWTLSSRLGADAVRIAKLEKDVAEQDRKGAELTARLTAATAGRDAAALAAAVGDRIGRFVDDKKAGLRDAALLARLATAPGAAAAAPELLRTSPTPLDQVVVYGAKGQPVATAPAGAAPTWAPLPADKLIACKGSAEPVFFWKPPAKAGPWTLAVGMPFRGGPKRAFLGVLLEAASLDNILKGAGDGLTPDTETRFLVVEKTGTVAFAPTPESIGKLIKDMPELAALDGARDGAPVEIKLDLARWVAVKRPGPLGVTVIGLAAIGAPAGAGAAAPAGTSQKAPVLVLAVIVAAAFLVSLVLIVMPLGRAGALARAAEAIAAGSTSVEFKDANAADELGTLARALEKVGENLAAERQHKEEITATHANLQRDHARAQDEIRELKEYNTNLEAKARQTQAALEGEVATARGELETARTQIEGLRGEGEALKGKVAAGVAGVAQRDAAIAAGEAAIAQRDQALAEAGASLASVQAELAQLQGQFTAVTNQLNELRAEMESKKSAPAAVFSLFAEASEALTVEMNGLVELVQEYVGSIVTTTGGTMSDEQQQFVTTVINRSAKSQRLMGDLRDFANIARPDGLAREPINLVALLTDVVAAVQQAADDRGIMFVSDLPATLPECIGDEARLRQLFTVILTHAIRFTPENGEVKLSVALREGIAGIRIEDGAEPIPLKSEEVFDHFHPADEELQEMRGTGLRFPILRAIAAAHGGSVDLAITETGGNLYFFRLPVREGAPDSDATAALFAGVSSGEAPVPFDFGGGAAAAAAVAEGGFPSFEQFAAQGPAVFGAPAVPAAAEAFEGGAAPAASEPPVFDFGAVPDLSAAGPTTDSIMAEPAAPEFPAPEGLGTDLWTVPGDLAAPPTLDALEALPPADLSVPDLAAAPSEPPPADAPPPLFGNDEIIQE